MSGHDRLEAHRRRTGRALLAAFWPNVAVWVALLVLLFASLGLAYMPLGAWALPVGLAIGVVKAALVLYAFMTLRRAPALVLLVVAAALLFAAVLFALTFNDLFSRV